MADRAAPDLGDLVRVHREPWLPRTRRGRVATVVALVAGVLLLVGSAVLVVPRSGAWAMLPAVAALLPLLLRPLGTGVDPEGLHRRQGVLRRRRATWADVVEVRPAGRWREWGSARLGDGRHLELVGVTPQDVERLSAALAAARRRATQTARD